MDDGREVRQLQKRRTSEHERRSGRGERVEFGEAKEEERMTNGTAGSGTPHSSSCRFLYPGPTLEKMEELIIDQERKRRGEELAMEVQEHKNKLLRVCRRRKMIINSSWERQSMTTTCFSVPLQFLPAFCEPNAVTFQFVTLFI